MEHVGARTLNLISMEPRRRSHEEQVLSLTHMTTGHASSSSLISGSVCVVSSQKVMGVYTRYSSFNSHKNQRQDFFLSELIKPLFHFKLSFTFCPVHNMSGETRV